MKRVHVNHKGSGEVEEGLCRGKEQKREGIEEVGKRQERKKKSDIRKKGHWIRKLKKENGNGKK